MNEEMNQQQNNGYQNQNGYQQNNGYQNQNGYQQNNGYQNQNVYQSNGYQNQGDAYAGYNGENYLDREKKSSIGFGIASLVLGIISLVLFCTCINIPLAILAIIFGIVQLVRSDSKGMAIGGLITGAFSIVALIIYWALVFNQIAEMPGYMQQYEEQFPQIFEDMQEDSYYNDYEFDFDQMTKDL